MSRYGSRLRNVADMLSVVSEGARKTHIMYGANLSYKLLRHYLREVLESGFARSDDDGWFEITQKGRVFLDRCNRYFGDSEGTRDLIDDIENERKKKDLDNQVFHR